MAARKSSRWQRSRQPIASPVKKNGHAVRISINRCRTKWFDAFSRSKREGGRRPDEGTFVATVSNIYIFMREPSPALSGTLSHPVSLCFSGRERANAAAISLDQLRMHQIALCSARDGVKG